MVITQKRSLRIWSSVTVSWVWRCSRIVIKKRKLVITITRLCKHFHGCKNDYFQMKKLDIFLIFAQNIDFGYTLELIQFGVSNGYPQSMFKGKNKKMMLTL